MTEIDISKLVLNVNCDEQVTPMFNEIKKKGNIFEEGDVLWELLDANWNNKIKLKEYFDSMVKTYVEHGHKKALVFMMQQETLDIDMTYDDNFMNYVNNKIIMSKEEEKYIITNGRHRVILFHYLFEKVQPNKSTIFVYINK